MNLLKLLSEVRLYVIWNHLVLCVVLHVFWQHAHFVSLMRVSDAFINEKLDDLVPKF